MVDLLLAKVSIPAPDRFSGPESASAHPREGGTEPPESPEGISGPNERSQCWGTAVSETDASEKPASVGKIADGTYADRSPGIGANCAPRIARKSCRLEVAQPLAARPTVQAARRQIRPKRG
jgi:hypothetical protein